MKKFLISGIAAAISLAIAGTAAADGSDKMNGVYDQLISKPIAELEWIPVGDTGIKYANYIGDLLTDDFYVSLVNFPAGLNNPFHLHTKDIPTFVSQGTFYAVIDGKRTEYPAGSFYSLPGGTKHFSGCMPGLDCILFQFQNGAFDLVPQEEE